MDLFARMHAYMYVYMLVCYITHQGQFCNTPTQSKSKQAPQCRRAQYPRIDARAAANAVSLGALPKLQSLAHASSVDAGAGAGAAALGAGAGDAPQKSISRFFPLSVAALAALGFDSGSAIFFLTVTLAPGNTSDSFWVVDPPPPLVLDLPEDGGLFFWEEERLAGFWVDSFAFLPDLSIQLDKNTHVSYLCMPYLHCWQDHLFLRKARCMKSLILSFCEGWGLGCRSGSHFARYSAAATLRHHHRQTVLIALTAVNTSYNQT